MNLNEKEQKKIILLKGSLNKIFNCKHFLLMKTKFSINSFSN